MLLDLLKNIADQPDDADFHSLEQLLKHLRPMDENYPEESISRIDALTNLLASRADLLTGLQRHIDNLLLPRRHLYLYADTGILDNEGLVTGIWRRINERLLPPVADDAYLDDAFSRLIRRGRDAAWIEAVPDECWVNLIRLLLNGKRRDEVSQHARLQQLDALRVLSHRVSAMGVEPELVRKHSALKDFESPFLALSAETERFVRHQREQLQGLREGGIDHLQMQVLMEQCHDMLRKIRRQTSRQGVSVSLTHLLVRLQQNLQRMALMLDFIADDAHLKPLLLVRLLKLMSHAERQRRSIRALFSRNTELLARNITEHASETGDHYVTTNHAGFFGMWRSAGKAGFIVAFMALIKILSARLALAPIAQAMLYSLNYSFGFMLIHALHGIIATKQPAMTASHIAASIEDVPDRKVERQLGKLTQLCVDVFRSQLIAIFGNVGIAFPVALLIGLAWQSGNDVGPVSAVKSLQLLHDLSPIDSLALFHAAIAGFFLFLSGIISGYYDNQAIYSRIPERVAALHLLRRLSAARRERIAAYLRHNLGALAGSFYFGIMLGSMGTIGEILGLPLDIRHIAFATANFAYALIGLDFQVSWQVWVISIFGIAAIGLTNLGVSFSLALMLALKSRGVQFRLWLPLLKLILQHLRKHPRDFFWPPSSIAVTPTDQR